MSTPIGRNQLVGPACWVCGTRFKTALPPGPANEERHHICPRNAGGTDGPLVSLCDTHHGTLHKIAQRLHKSVPYSDLLIGSNEMRTKRLMWLAVQVVKSEKATADDPNKVMKNAFHLSKSELKLLSQLQKVYPNKSRNEIVVLALQTLYQKVLASR